MDFLCQDICGAAVSTQPRAESQIARSPHHSYGHWCLLVALHHEWHDIMVRPNWCAFTSVWLTVYWNYLWFRHHHHHHHRRKFRSQTSDSMERWKAEQRSRVRRWKADKRSRVRRKKIQLQKVRRKKIHTRTMLGKSWIAAFFQGFVGRLGRKVGSLKRRVRSHVFRGDMKIPRRCGAKHICNSKCTKHTLDDFLKFSCQKLGTPLWREVHLQLKMYKTHHSRATFRSSAVSQLIN